MFARRAAILRERPEESSEASFGGEAIAEGDGEGGVDASSGITKAIASFWFGLSSDEVGRGLNPELSIESSVGDEGVVDEGAQGGVTIIIEDDVALAHERLEERVPSLEPSADQGVGDGIGVMDVMDVLHDSEQVARASTPSGTDSRWRFPSKIAMESTMSSSG